MSNSSLFPIVVVVISVLYNNYRINEIEQELDKTKAKVAKLAAANATAMDLQVKMYNKLVVRQSRLYKASTRNYRKKRLVKN